MFDKFESFIPYGQYGDLHTQGLELWRNGPEEIAVRQPGRYQDKTMGGDCVILYTGFLKGKPVVNRRITYDDLLREWVTFDADKRKQTLDRLHAGEAENVFEAAVTALTVAEHRRYKQHAKCTTESYGFPHKGKLWTGGRFLLLNFLVLLHHNPELLEAACASVKLGSRAFPVLQAMAKV